MQKNRLMEPVVAYAALPQSDFYAFSPQKVESGYGYTALQETAEVLDLSEIRLASLLDIPIRTLKRRKELGVLTVEESDRLYRLHRTLEAAQKAFGDAHKAVRWLLTPAALFTEKMPVELVRTSQGYDQVRDELARIEYGFLA